jgi:hypothetical protein
MTALVGGGLISLAFYCGMVTERSNIHQDIENFAMFEVNDHIYKAELHRAPYTPESVSIKDIHAARQGKTDDPSTRPSD